jgi:hypothetical protein
MATIIVGYHLAKRASDGREFISLDLQGDIEMVQSMETGNFYATNRKASIPSTFSEDTAKELIGTKLPGVIKRVESEPFDFTIPGTNEVIQLQHRYVYSAEETEAVAPYSTLPKKMMSLRGSMVNS